MQQGETTVKELKASQEKAISQSSELHGKEVEELRGQADKLKLELSSSKERTHELEKLVSELQSYKEQVQVSTWNHRAGTFSLVPSTYINKYFGYFL